MSKVVFMVVLKLMLDNMEKIQEILGATSCKRGATRPQFKTYTRYSRVDDKEQKKVLGVFNGCFETHTVISSANCPCSLSKSLVYL